MAQSIKDRVTERALQTQTPISFEEAIACGLSKSIFTDKNWVTENGEIRRANAEETFAAVKKLKTRGPLASASTVQEQAIGKARDVVEVQGRQARLRMYVAEKTDDDKPLNELAPVPFSFQDNEANPWWVVCWAMLGMGLG